MRKAACFLYIVCMMFYLEVASNTYFWWGFNMVTVVLFAGIVCGFMASKNRLTESERLLFWYMFGVNMARGIYTIFCTHAVMIGKNEWVRPATHLFVVLVGITFFLFLTYLARQRE